MNRAQDRPALAGQDLLTAEFTNDDVGEALGLFNLTDFRRNLERKRKGKQGEEESERPSLALFPRPRVFGPAGPRYRLAHAYEYALFIEIASIASREAARAILFKQLQTMKANACFRINSLSNDERHIILGPSGFTIEEDPFAYAGFVEFPGIYFDPEFLERDRSNRLFWITNGHEHDPVVLTALQSLCLGDAADRVWASYLKPFRDKESLRRTNRLLQIDVTETLAQVDERLLARLERRALQAYRFGKGP